MSNPTKKASLTLFVVAVASIGLSCSAEKQTPDQEFKKKSSSKQSDILDEKLARILATKLANDEFSRKKIFTKIHPQSWSNVRKSKGRWELIKVAPAGSQAWVSFDLDGEKPDIKVEYALE
jgi:hypothetical protein